MELGSVLALLRNTKGLNQREFAKELGVSNGAVAMWETNKRQPDLEMLRKIAAFFNVSTDYILGIEKSGGNNYANFLLDESEFGEDFKFRVRSLMDEQRMSEDKFMQLTGFDKTQKDAYIYGNKRPSIEDLIKIAGALRVSTDYLLDVSRRKRITDEEELMLQSFNRCDDECKKYLLAKAGVLCVEGISAVAATEYGKYVDEEKKYYPSSGTGGTGA